MTKKSQKIFYTVCILLILVISAWGFAFNKAYLVVLADDALPFQVQVGSQTHQCQNQCQIELTPRSYNVVISRPGFTSTETRVFLTRGKTQELQYDGIFLPVFDPLEESEITNFENFRFQQNPENTDQQVFQIFTGEDFRTVSTFRSPLNEPNAVISPDQTTAFIWSESSETLAEYYLINNAEESRQRLSLNLPFNSLPTEFRLLTNNFLLFKQNGQVYLYNFSSNSYSQFPISTVDHVSIIYSDDSSVETFVLFSDRNLASQRVFSPRTGTSLTQLIEDGEIEDESALAEQFTARPDKIFAYNPSTGSFQFLGPIPDSLIEPFRFQTVYIDQELTEILTTQDNSFQIILSQN